MHVARLVTPPGGACIVCALRRRVYGEIFESGQALGGYICPLFELHTPDYAKLPVPLFCPCRLRARVRSRVCLCTVPGGTINGSNCVSMLELDAHLWRI